MLLKCIYICLGGTDFTTLIPSSHSPPLGCAAGIRDQSSRVRLFLVFKTIADATFVHGNLWRSYSAQLTIFHVHLFSRLILTILSISTFYKRAATSITQNISFFHLLQIVLLAPHWKSCSSCFMYSFFLVPHTTSKRQTKVCWIQTSSLELTEFGVRQSSLQYGNSKPSSPFLYYFATLLSCAVQVTNMVRLIRRWYQCISYLLPSSSPGYLMHPIPKPNNVLTFNLLCPIFFRLL